MSEYRISIESRGREVPVGIIRGDDYNDACFSYSDTYLKSAYAVPISVSLPLSATPFSPEKTRCFFEGLLPEGFTRRSVAQWMHVSDSDYLAMLHNLGKECLGAVRIRQAGDAEESHYEKLDIGQVRALAAEGATKSAELVTRAHLSLTGASGKAGLYYRAEDNSWYLPKGSAPSTHIVKQSHVRLSGIVTNEQLCLMTAGRCGIDVPESFIIDTGAGNDSEILLATKRYDRLMPEAARNTDGATTDLMGEPVSVDRNGLPYPRRLHQEDFAQALGRMPAEKYESGEGHYLKDMFDLLLACSSNPIRDRLALWDRVVFSCLAGNSDAHIKNYSLLYSEDLQQIRLAPAYDILSTSIYDSSTRDLSVRIGDARTLDELTEQSFRQAAHEVGLGERVAMRRFDLLRKQFIPAITSAAGELTELGFVGAKSMAEKIVSSGGMRHL